jgi:O-antigen ligase
MHFTDNRTKDAGPLIDKWPRRFDRTSVWVAALLPVGIVIGNAGFEAVVGLTIALWLARAAIAKTSPISGHLLRHPLLLPWLVWWGCVVVSLSINGPGNKGWAHDVVLIRFMLYLAAVLDLSGRRDIARPMCIGLMAAVAWAGLNTAIAYAWGHDLLGKPLVRYTGKLKEAARIAGLSMYAAPFLLAWGIWDRGETAKMRAWAVGLGMVATVQLLQLRVRTAMLAAVAGMFFFTIYFIKKRVSFKWAALVLVGGAAGLGLFFHLARLWDLSSIYDRIFYWKVAWVMWLDHPVFGASVSNFQDMYREMALSGRIEQFVAPDGRVFQLAEVYHAHNIVLMLLASTGMAGLLAFGWLFINFIRLIGADFNHWRIGMAAWPVVIAVAGLTGFNIYHSWYQAVFAWLTAMVGIGVGVRDRMHE